MVIIKLVYFASLNSSAFHLACQLQTLGIAASIFVIN